MGVSRTSSIHVIVLIKSCDRSQDGQFMNKGVLQTVNPWLALRAHGNGAISRAAAPRSVTVQYGRFPDQGLDLWNKLG